MDDVRAEQLERLYRSERERLSKIAHRRVGAAAAADVVQDLFAALWGRACEHVKFTPSYLARATRFTAISHFRAESRRAKTLSGLTEAQYAAPALSPEQILAARQELQRTEAAIQALPVRTRQVFLLNRLHGCTYDEIALGLEISVSTVEREMARAILACRAAIPEAEPPPAR
ncbi:sigma-70 family RNA polymerase sigma factor [Xinfangfangia sp. D13-10-4-6]|uniref:RNA polymerase sigma factor n=1 Tax=Pseudogemmobacter hezensis TaxID=2737662 RepID=UPI00155174C8|nr:sigma-70 family RNA polymerase sigma factor [Pseudogemmobacter hezensis]NPD16064.1 sigma-70 family RNA polymerase sigma factor [Pseudogemmobacter hezensis]